MHWPWGAKVKGQDHTVMKCAACVGMHVDTTAWVSEVELSWWMWLRLAGRHWTAAAAVRQSGHIDAGSYPQAVPLPRPSHADHRRPVRQSSLSADTQATSQLSLQLCELMSSSSLHSRVKQMCHNLNCLYHLSHLLNCLLLAAVLFRLLQLKSGTVCQRPSSHRHHCRLSIVRSKEVICDEARRDEMDDTSSPLE